MTHKEYTTPLTNIIIRAIENLMITASPGVGGGYDPGKPIEGKGTNCFEDEEDTSLEPENDQDIGDYW